MSGQWSPCSGQYGEIGPGSPTEVDKLLYMGANPSEWFDLESQRNSGNNPARNRNDVDDLRSFGLSTGWCSD